jgi:hypothetical protein
MQQITKFISLLATDFHLDEADKLFKDDDDDNYKA